ncbi:hypothetical protein ACHAXT_004184 [Thalassiosira profunda]
MMASEHDIDPSSQEGGGGLHHRDAAHHESSSTNGGGLAVAVGAPPRTRKRRSRDRINVGGGHVRIDVDDNYAKYGKRRVKRKTLLQGNATFVAICVGSFVLGFAWMHYARDATAPDPRPQLRHPDDANPRLWKPRQPANDGTSDKQMPADRQQQRRNRFDLRIPRFDRDRYVQKHPQAIELEGWNAPVAFRSFPYARQTHGPIKNIDSDYGGLTYHSLKNEAVFARVIPERLEVVDDDEDDGVVPGAFDPDSIYPEQSLHRRNRKRKKTSGGYPNLDSRGRKVLRSDYTKDELQKHYDDDTVKILPRANDGKTKEPRACQKAAFSQLYFPTCNDFHERMVGRAFDDPEQLVHPRPEHELYVKYLAHGYYRDVWVVEDSPWIWPDRYPKEKEQMSDKKKYGVEDEERTNEMARKAYRSVVLKTLQMKHPYNPEQFEEVRLEAVIMERLTQSPRIMNTYGHCGYSTLAEVVPIEFEEAMVPGEGYQSHEDVEKRNKKGVRPYNNFTATEKLKFALEMAESLADLHGFEDGVIVHDDVQMCQWLRLPDGTLKLGDFNRATIMQWDLLKGEYCKFNNGNAFANYRAPEEFAARNLNEQIDTFSFGNNIYAMLTGLWNFYDTDDDGVVQKKLIDGGLAYVDARYRERSFAETKLVELMEKCWIYDPDKRISIFDAVAFLRKAVKENAKRGNKSSGDTSGVSTYLRMRASASLGGVAAAIALGGTAPLLASAFLPPNTARRRASVNPASALQLSTRTSSRTSESDGGARRRRSNAPIATFRPSSQLHSSAAGDVPITSAAPRSTPEQPPFSLPTALFLAGLAFDAYVEPPPTSSRWERGSSGVNVAFLSAAYTRSLYKAIVEVTPLRASDLPDEDDAAESLITGGGVDAALLVSVVEGAWTEDVKKLEKEQFHNGVLDLAGCAHVGRSSTAWSNVDETKARRNKAKGGSGAYHIKSSWGKGGQAVWEGDPPFYLYVQDPKTARLVFTLFDEDVVGGGQPIGSAHRRLSELLPSTASNDAVSMLKSQVIEQLKQTGKLQEAISVRPNPETGEMETLVDQDVVLAAINESYGASTKAGIKMTSKPRKKDKGGQRAMGMAAGAMIAGPAGAAVGGILASMYEGEVRGKVELELKYTPIPQVDLKLKERERYQVKGGLPGIEWGELYDKHLLKALSGDCLATRASDVVPSPDPRLAGSDLEFCCFVTHDNTGCSCAIYRSLERRLICVSFRGTCAPVDLITDASIAQDAWVEGEDVEKADTVKVHSGFRKSLQSISRRLKELMLAAVAPGEDLSEYDVLVTGHSLGGALATCFVMDVAEYGMDAGRGLPQLEPSEAWWNSIASTLTGKKVQLGAPPPPPRPKSLKMYNFGSPRVGNDAFCKKFDSMVSNGSIDEAYRIVNDQDVVTRFPRTVNALVLGNIGYDHCGPTVLITELKKQIAKRNEREGSSNLFFQQDEMLWIEGESNDAACPVRDGNARSDPLGSGSLLGDLRETFQQGDDNKEEGSSFNLAKLGNIAEKVTGRLQQLTAEDIGSIVGIDKEFTQREVKFLQSIFSGEGLSHHLEDKYYQGMGMIAGYGALPGEPLTPLEEIEGMDIEEIKDAIISSESGVMSSERA